MRSGRQSISDGKFLGIEASQGKITDYSSFEPQIFLENLEFRPQNSLNIHRIFAPETTSHLCLTLNRFYRNGIFFSFLSVLEIT